MVQSAAAARQPSSTLPSFLPPTACPTAVAYRRTSKIQCAFLAPRSYDGSCFLCAGSEASRSRAPEEAHENCWPRRPLILGKFHFPQLRPSVVAAVSPAASSSHLFLFPKPPLCTRWQPRVDLSWGFIYWLLFHAGLAQSVRIRTYRFPAVFPS